MTIEASDPKRTVVQVSDHFIGPLASGLRSGTMTKRSALAQLVY